MSSNSSDSINSEADQSFSFTQQGGGLGNILCRQPSNKIATVSQSKRKANNSLEEKSVSGRKQIGFSEKVKTRRKQRRRRTTKKISQDRTGCQKI